jgi:isopentenyldiphosphate isomerase
VSTEDEHHDDESRAGGAVDELVALYDPASAQPRVVGAAPRSRVRAENLPHAATAVLLMDDDGRIYVHRRTESKDVYPGTWDAWAGGVVRAGEHPSDTAVRELAEELGVHDTDLEPLFTAWFRDDRIHELAVTFRARWHGEHRHGPVVHQADEVAEGRWMTLDEVRELLDDPARPMIPDGRVALERYLAMLADGSVGDDGAAP